MDCIIVIFWISGKYPIRKDKLNIWSNGIVLNKNSSSQLIVEHHQTRMIENP